MKTLITLSFILTLSMTSVYAQSQTCDCKSDLDFLVEKIEDMPSYKKQIKGEKLLDFQNKYHSLSAKMTHPIAIDTCFRLLQEQLMLVNDLHANLYTTTSYLSVEDYENDSRIDAFLMTDVFKNHPISNRNLSELKKDLSTKPNNSIEGIYNQGETLVIGIYKTSDNTIEGVVLSSESKIWIPGQLKFTAKKNTHGKYDMVTYHDITRKLSMIKGLTFENGRIYNNKKQSMTSNFELADKANSDWEFKQINDEVQYVYFGNFSSFSTKNRKAFKTFYETYKKAFNAKNIIIDLRNNGGGNKKFSDPFIKLFKKSKAKIYIITNSFTGSNAEQFTVKLKELDEAVHLGQTTFGVIAYGINHGKTYNMPSGYFSVLPTDMNFHDYYEYEGKGVSPDLKLSFDTDWIEQTLELINTNPIK